MTKYALALLLVSYYKSTDDPDSKYVLDKTTDPQQKSEYKLYIVQSHM